MPLWQAGTQRVMLKRAQARYCGPSYPLGYRVKSSVAAGSVYAFRGSRRLVCTAPALPSVQVTRREGGIVCVTLSRTDKLNALNMDMFRELAQAARALITDRSVRAVVVHGNGRAFCAGLDVKSVMHPTKARANIEELLHRPEGSASNLAQDVGYLWRLIPAPVIASVHGVCLGGGFQIALGADLRVSSHDCKFSVMEAKWGLIPDMSASVTLPELVPKDVAMELTMTGRVFDAREALKLGLVTRLADDPLEESVRLAYEIARRSPDATAASKRLWHASYASPDDGRALQMETRLQRRLMGGWNQLACTAKGLGVPSLLQPGFLRRDAAWEDEVEDEEEKELHSLLSGDAKPRDRAPTLDAEPNPREQTVEPKP